MVLLSELDVGVLVDMNDGILTSFYGEVLGGGLATEVGEGRKGIEAQDSRKKGSDDDDDDEQRLKLGGI